MVKIKMKIKQFMNKLSPRVITASMLSIFLAGIVYGSYIPQSDSYAMQRSVKLSNGRGSCSGEQIIAPSGKNYILTAAHCKVLASKENTITVETENHVKLERAIIAEDPKSDLLLLEGLPNLRGLEIADHYERNQDVRTFTHGRGFNTYKTEGKLIQFIDVNIALRIVDPNDANDCKMEKNLIIPVEYFGETVNVCMLSVREMAMTAMIVPGSSGGMIVNGDGQLIGVVSAGDGNFGYIVALDHIHNFLLGY